MDPLSGAASIIAIVDIAGTVISYLANVKDAPKGCRECTVEICNSIPLLHQINDRLSKASSLEPRYAEIHALEVKDGPLDQYKQALQHLVAKIEPKSKLGKLANALTWNFVKEEVASILARIERLKSHVSLALQMDG